MILSGGTNSKTAEGLWVFRCFRSHITIFFAKYNMDLRTGKRVALKQMLGADYAELVNESIREQIAERQKAGEIFFTAEEGLQGFRRIYSRGALRVDRRKQGRSLRSKKQKPCLRMNCWNP